MRERWIDRTGAVATGVFGVALLLRLLHLAQSASGPTFFAPVVDAETYDRLARSFAAGGGFTHEFFWQPPFYPVMLGVIYRVADGSIVVAKLLQAVIGSWTCVLTFRLADDLFERRAGLLAGLLAAGSGPAIYFDGELLATGWAGFWSVALILLFLHAARCRSASASAALGLVGALSVLTRPPFLPVFLAGCLWLGFVGRRDGGSRRAAPRLALVALGFLALAVPVALLSRAHTGRASLLPTSGGLNLYIGNNPEADRTVAIRPGWDWKELTQLPRHHGITERRDTGPFFARLVLDYARRDPAGFARGLAVKGLQLLCSRELPRNTDVYLDREHSTVLRLLVWKVGGFGFPAGVLLPLAALGIVLGFDRLPAPLRWHLLLYPLSIVLVFVSARYRTPLLPLLAVVAAGGCVALPRALAERRHGRVAAAAGAALLVLVLGTAFGPFPQERANYRAERHYFLGTRALNAGDLESALTHLDLAVTLEPDHSDAHNQLGLAHVGRGDYRAALADFERAVEANPRSATARTNLARVHAATGHPDEALRHFRTALAQDPYGSYTRRQFGLALVGMGRFAEAAELLRPLVAADPTDAAAREALARAERGESNP
jgi:Tfp pilus assembly protein PilF